MDADIIAPMSSASQALSEPAPPPRTRWRTRIGIVATTVARLVLGAGMMPYGISKLMNLQFQVGASVYARPLGDIPGTGLTWAFLGYSPAFQFLMGVFETVPSLMLLFARTRRLGALLLFPVLLNVVLINYFLNLWTATQIISSVLLVLNIFLILADSRMYLGFLSQLLAKPAPIANRKLRIAAKIAGFAIPAAIVAPAIFDLHSYLTTEHERTVDFIGRRQINRAGTWNIESLRVAGEPVAVAAGSMLYFDFSHQCVYSDGAHHSSGKFEADKPHGTFQITGIPLAGSDGALQGSYRVNGDRLVLDGNRDGQPVTLVLHRTQWGVHPRVLPPQ
jgi:uncharacterized membrane protein YphA (DoxX/SURF4 family)